MKILRLLGIYTLLITGCINLYSYDYIPDDVSVSDILLIFSHNSAQSKAYGWWYHQQLGTLQEQWKAGMRGGKLNLQWRWPLFRNETPENRCLNWRPTPFIALAHEPDPTDNCAVSLLQKTGEVMKAVDYLKELTTLIKKNPKDIVILVLEDYLDRTSSANGADDYSPDQIRELLHQMLEDSGISKYALKLGDEYRAKDGHKALKWPTIGEMRRTNKRVIIFDDDPVNTQDSPILNYRSSDILRTTDWRTWENDMKNNTCTMMDDNRQTTGFLVVQGLEMSIQKGTPLGDALDFVNKIKELVVQGVPIKTADYEYMNSEPVLRKRIDLAQQASPGTPPSILCIDYLEVGDVYNTVKKINLERIAQVKNNP